MATKEIIPTPRKVEAGEPVWELARLFPYQGEWREEDYLALETNLFIEFDHGYLEFLPMPTRAHQRIMLYLYRLLWAFVESRQLGEVLTAPMPVKLSEEKYREPDVVFTAYDSPEKFKGAYPTGADLVMEVVSGSQEDRKRDLVVKREEYAKASIPEYWIIDPENNRITVLHLSGKIYQEHGVFGEGERASSVLLDGFEVEVTAVFAAAKG